MASLYASFDGRKVTDLMDDFIIKFEAIDGKSKQFVDLLSVLIYRDVIDHFDKQEGPNSGWQKWSTKYAERMSKLGKGANKVLQDTGRLRQSFLPNKWRTTDDSIVWYNNAKTRKGFPYAYAHNEGGPKLPRRQFMWLSDKAIKDIEKQTKVMLEK